MGLIDSVRSLFRAKSVPVTPEEKYCQECRDVNVADIKRYEKYVSQYGEQLAVYRSEGMSPELPAFQDTLFQWNRYRHSAYEAQVAQKHIRCNTAKDIADRERVLNNFAGSVQKLLPDDCLLRFHGTPMYFAEEILKAKEISSTADRFDGFVKSSDGTGEISVSDVAGLDRTVNYFMDVTAHNKCLPCGCLFVLDGTGQTEEQHGRSVMNKVSFAAEPERLRAVVSTPENQEKLKALLADAGLSPQLAYTFDEFVSELELEVGSADRAELENSIDAAMEKVAGNKEIDVGRVARNTDEVCL